MDSLEAVLLAFFEKRLAADAENLRGAADAKVHGFQRRGDDLALDIFEGAEASRGADSASRGANIFRKIVGIEPVIAGEDDGAFERIAELANVAGPMVSTQHMARRIA